MRLTVETDDLEISKALAALPDAVIDLRRNNQNLNVDFGFLAAYYVAVKTVKDLPKLAKSLLTTIDPFREKKARCKIKLKGLRGVVEFEVHEITEDKLFDLLRQVFGMTGGSVLDLNAEPNPNHRHRVVHQDLAKPLDERKTNKEGKGGASRITTEAETAEPSAGLKKRVARRKKDSVNIESSKAKAEVPEDSTGARSKKIRRSLNKTVAREEKSK